jgi:hypothetical protein
MVQQLRRRAVLVPLIALIVGFALGAGSPARASDGYRVVDVQEAQSGPLRLTEWTVQAGSDPAARFTVHRLRKPSAPSAASAAPRGVLLLMPGGGSKFALYSVAEDGVVAHSFAGELAVRGFEVWGYSPRTSGLAPGACSGAVDCAGMRDWGMAAVVADALYIRRRIRAVHGRVEPVIGGFSLGAMSTLAVLDAEPRGWAGAVLWEGMLYSEDPTVLAANGVVCASLEAQLAAGELWDEATYSSLQLIYGLASADPDGPSPLPGFEGLTNRQALLLLLTTPQPAPPAYVPGYTLIAGSLAGFSFASEDRIGLLISQFNAY